MTKFVRGCALAMVAGLSLAAAGCGGNPLLGTWRSPTLVGQTPPAGQGAFTTDFTFNADQTLAVHVTATGGESAVGCLAVLDINNLRWASPDGAGAMNTVAITGTTMAFDEITGCADASANHARRENTSYSNATDLHGTYTITGNQLTLSLMMGGSPQTLTFTRQ